MMKTKMTTTIMTMPLLSDDYDDDNVVAAVAL